MPTQFVTAGCRRRQSRERGCARKTKSSVFVWLCTLRSRKHLQLRLLRWRWLSLLESNPQCVRGRYVASPGIASIRRVVQSRSKNRKMGKYERFLGRQRRFENAGPLKAFEDTWSVPSCSRCWTSEPVNYPCLLSGVGRGHSEELGLKHAIAEPSVPMEVDWLSSFP